MQRVAIGFVFAILVCSVALGLTGDHRFRIENKYS